MGLLLSLTHIPPQGPCPTSLGTSICSWPPHPCTSCFWYSKHSFCSLPMSCTLWSQTLCLCASLCQLCMLFPLFQPVAAALPPGSQPPDTSTGTSGEALACVTTTLTQELSGHYVLHTNMYHRFVPLRQYSIVVRTQTLGSNPGPVSYLATRSWTNI